MSDGGDRHRLDGVVARSHAQQDGHGGLGVGTGLVELPELAVQPGELGMHHRPDPGAFDVVRVPQGALGGVDRPREVTLVLTDMAEGLQGDRPDGGLGCLGEPLRLVPAVVGGAGDREDDGGDRRDGRARRAGAEVGEQIAERGEDRRAGDPGVDDHQ